MLVKSPALLRIDPAALCGQFIFLTPQGRLQQGDSMISKRYKL